MSLTVAVAAAAKFPRSYYWVAAENLESGEWEIFGDGFAETKELATELAESALIGSGRTFAFVARNAFDAKHVYRVARARKPKPKDVAHAPNNIEYVYYWSEGEISPGEFRALRVIKRTKRSVFIKVHHDWPGNEDNACVRVDREKLERDGSVWCRAAREHFYTAEAVETRKREWRANRNDRMSALGAPLGLSGDFTAADVRAAFNRAALVSHPDHGGSHEEFLALIEARDNALRYVGQPHRP